MKRIGCQLLKFLLFVLLILGCQKEYSEYLEKYTGFFTFTLIWHDQFWILDIDTTYTRTFDGQINKYAGGLSNADTRLSIDFSRTIHPEVQKGGQFINQYDTHEGFSGKFLNADEVLFEFWQNSAGFSKKAIVSGIRK